MSERWTGEQRLDGLTAAVQVAIERTGGRLRYPYRCGLLPARRTAR